MAVKTDSRCDQLAVAAILTPVDSKSYSVVDVRPNDVSNYPVVHEIFS